MSASNLPFTFRPLPDQDLCCSGGPCDVKAFNRLHAKCNSIEKLREQRPDLQLPRGWNCYPSRAPEHHTEAARQRGSCGCLAWIRDTEECLKRVGNGLQGPETPLASFPSHLLPTALPRKPTASEDSLASKSSSGTSTKPLTLNPETNQDAMATAKSSNDSLPQSLTSETSNGAVAKATKKSSSDESLSTNKSSDQTPTPCEAQRGEESDATTAVVNEQRRRDNVHAVDNVDAVDNVHAVDNVDAVDNVHAVDNVDAVDNVHAVASKVNRDGENDEVHSAPHFSQTGPCSCENRMIQLKIRITALIDKAIVHPPSC